MIQLRVNFNEERAIWDHFVATSPQRSIFVYSTFLDSLQAKYNLVTCYDNNQIVAGAIIIYTEFANPITHPFPFTQYQGMLFADNSSKATHSQHTLEFKIAEYFISQLTEHFNNYCLCHSWRLRDLRAFQWHNYHRQDQSRFKIDLRYTGILRRENYQDFEHYLTSVRKVKKQEFKKAAKLLSFSMGNDVGALDRLHAKTFARQDLERTRQESQLVKSIANHALENNYGELCCAMLENEAVSSVLFLYDDRTAYYLFGANDPTHRKTFSGTYLLINMIKRAFEKGMQEIDFLGVNSPDRGDFKISLGADLVPHFITTFNSK